ncbi:MAG: hypothetical protein ACI915_005514, partial [Gammaproteobacteria bacterium]
LELLLTGLILCGRSDATLEMQYLGGVRREQ